VVILDDFNLVLFIESHIYEMYVIHTPSSLWNTRTEFPNHGVFVRPADIVEHGMSGFSLQRRAQSLLPYWQWSSSLAQGEMHRIYIRYAQKFPSSTMLI
jgi:hypothetical protein